MSKEILEKANYWATSNDFDSTTRNEIKSLIDQNNIEELTNRFYRDLEFGTGGLRGILGAGTAYMNIYNIRKATSALVGYIQELKSDKNISVAISYDSRNFSPEFAQAAAEIISGMGGKAFITKELRPVPMLSFMVRHFKCDAGICITASHNPPNYNGFKVYWSTGGQLIPPHDKKIIASYGSIDTYSNFKSIDFEQGIKDKKIQIVHKELDLSLIHI